MNTWPVGIIIIYRHFPAAFLNPFSSTQRLSKKTIFQQLSEKTELSVFLATVFLQFFISKVERAQENLKNPQRHRS
jgi:hypothetical protein